MFHFLQMDLELLAVAVIILTTAAVVGLLSLVTRRRGGVLAVAWTFVGILVLSILYLIVSGAVWLFGSIASPPSPPGQPPNHQHRDG